MRNSGVDAPLSLTTTVGKGLIMVAHKYTPEERLAKFWSRVDKSGGEDACWNWLAGHNQKGYGVAQWNGKHAKAHRISYLLAHGEFDNRLLVLHACDNPRCVNPKHLFLGTHQDNERDKVAKGRHLQQLSKISKLSPDQVLEIRRRAALGGKGNKQVDLAREFSVFACTIMNIVHRRTWKHLP